MQKRVLMIMKKIQIPMRKTLRTVRILRRLKNLRILLKIQGILMMKIHTKRTMQISMRETLTAMNQKIHLTAFTLTAYCNCAQCCGTAGNLTASGTVPTAGRTVAMAGVPFGTQLLINGNVYTVEDLGTPYGHVDIYCDSHSEALSFGLQSAEVYQLN